jgi:hypothetical protein
MKIHNSQEFLTSAVLQKIFIASSTTTNSRSIGSHSGASISIRPMHRELDQDQLLLKLLDLALEFTIEKEGMLGEVMALFQDMHLEPGLQPALKLALHWGCPSPVSRTRAVFIGTGSRFGLYSCWEA